MKSKKFLLFIMCIIYVFCFMSACDKMKDNIDCVENDLLTTLDSIRDGNITSSGYYLYVSETLNRTTIAQKIADLVTYDIKKTTRDNNEAKVTVSFSLPDAVAVMEASLPSAESVEGVLEKFESELTKKKYIIQKDITLELIYIDDHWYLTQNLEMDDIFSGGLLEEYAQSNLNSFNKLLEDAQ